jgi:hypothetical protein
VIGKVLIVLAWSGLALAQAPSQPKVKVNMINVCSPSADEQQEMATALSKIPKQPIFSDDFEVDRGRTQLAESPNFLQPGSGMEMAEGSDTSDWVRIRREFSVQAMFSTVQYSFSVDHKSMVETIVFRVRDPKDLMQISIEDRASAVATPAAMLSTSTPADRIKLERFGKSSIVLTRCGATESGPAPDQSAYEPLFQSASSTVSRYRQILGARQIVPEELESVRAVHPKMPKPLPKKSSTKAK